MRNRRRDLLVLGGIAAAVLGVRALPWDRLGATEPAWAQIAGLPPFRRLEQDGAVSGASVATIGLDPAPAGGEEPDAVGAAVRADPCAALFGGALPPGVVPVAYFSAFRCPVCRALEPRLEAIVAGAEGRLRLIQHEWPIFGPVSELAARASVAAARQGLQQPLRQRLMRSALVSDEAVILAMAEAAGLDPVRLLRDMASAGVRDEIGRSRALAELFGFAGTPALVIGRTVVEGAVPDALLRRVIAEERALPPLVC